MFLNGVDSSQLIFRLTLVTLSAVVVLTLASQFGQYLFLELTTHFRLQYVLVAIVCAVVFTVLQEWKFVPIAIICAVLNAIYLGPYLRPASHVDADGPRLRLLHANVLKDNRDYGAVFDLVSKTKADLVVLQEVTDDWDNQTAVLKQKYSYIKSVPGPEGSGIAVLSRFPFQDEKVLQLDASTHIAILVRVTVEGRPVTLLSLHPTTPITPKKFANRNRQFAEAAKLLNAAEGLKILVGDLNTSMWSPYFRTLVEKSGLRDVRVGFGLLTSWPMPLPSFLRLPIDHCLVSSDVTVKDVQIGNAVSSDHLPLIVDLVLGPQASSPAR
jgi:endonuclease/exonuclease/phosphatase (EEP) superfamily protein YafD